jgi:hypothetical protein
MVILISARCTYVHVCRLTCGFVSLRCRVVGRVRSAECVPYFSVQVWLRHRRDHPAWYFVYCWQVHPSTAPRGVCHRCRRPLQLLSPIHVQWCWGGLVPGLWQRHVVERGRVQHLCGGAVQPWTGHQRGVRRRLRGWPGFGLPSRCHVGVRVAVPHRQLSSGGWLVPRVPPVPHWPLRRCPWPH